MLEHIIIIYKITFPTCTTSEQFLILEEGKTTMLFPKFGLTTHRNSPSFVLSERRYFPLAAREISNCYNSPISQLQKGML